MSLVCSSVCLALEPTTSLARYGRQSWTMENGLPQNTVSVLLQSRSGFLWAGTELGLARFDGQNFLTLDHATTASFPDAEIRCLLDAKDASQWIGTGDGLVHWVGGHARLMTTREGLPSNSIRGLAQSGDGTIWVWTELGLARWQEEKSGGSFHPISVADGLAGGTLTSIAADGQGALWTATTTGVSVLRQGRWQSMPDFAGSSEANHGASLVVGSADGDVLVANPRGVFLEHGGRSSLLLGRQFLPMDGVSFLARLGDGTLAVASKSTVLLARGPLQDARGESRGLIRLSVGRQLPGTRIEVSYADREGCLWVGTNHGLARISGGTVQLMPTTDALAASAVVSLFEDREGDLWVGTETSGLHILRDARFLMLGRAEGLSSDATTAIVEDAKGGVWIGTRDAGLNRVTGGLTATLTTRDGLLSNVILALAAAPDGDVWVGTPDGLSRIRAGRVSSFTSADGLPDDFIRSLLVAPDSSLWIGTRRGLTHLDRGHFQNFTQSDGLGSDLVGAMACTPNGDLWIATLNGLTRLHQGILHNFTTKDGLPSNIVTALDAAANGMLWVGTQNDGLSLWDGKQFLPVRSTLDGTRGQIPEVVHAIQQDDRGQLWMASDTGLARSDAQVLVSCAEELRCNFATLHFTTADGLRSRETSSNSHPTALRTRDGRLWFTTPRGVIIADPRHFAPSLSPPVVIERFAVDDQDQQGGNAGTVATRITAGHLRFQFDYAGLSFAAPQKLRYQYMLEGFDRNWIDAGSRRTAYYTNIPPARYRFRVRATIGDQTGTPSETELAFDLLPHFYQTAWFAVLLILLMAALIFLVFRRRVMRVEREFRAVMAERNRIAREIHDTLAQGYVGISVQLEVLGELLRHNRGELAAKHLELTKGYVREGLDDARQSIWALRSQDTGEQTLPVRLRRLVEKAEDRGLSTHLEIYGAYRALSPGAEKEVLRIAQEAIHNVKKHAVASHLNVRIEYDERTLVLTVMDDGKGFVTSGEKSGLDGHYGLTGMRERTALIRGRLEITSQPGTGTTVRIEVPAPTVSSRNLPNNTDASGKQPES